MRRLIPYAIAFVTLLAVCTTLVGIPADRADDLVQGVITDRIIAGPRVGRMDGRLEREATLWTPHWYQARV
jgi:hypothetical protein